MNYKQNIGQDDFTIPNKLGITDEDVIDKIVQLKMSILTSNFTFNEEKRELDYLKKLHNFLFGDIYYDAGNYSKRITPEILKEASNLIEEINSLSDYIDYGYDEINESLNNKKKELINLQLFDDGNNRTISAYFKIILDDYTINKPKDSKQK